MRTLPSGRLSSLLVLTCLASTPWPAHAAAVVFEGVGANAAEVQPTVDAFRAALGASNGVGGTFAGGRREINWDGVPAGSRSPLPGSFFNTTSPRGAVLSTPGTRLQVSGDCPGSACLLDDVTNGYQGSVEFGAFSEPRVFSPIGSNVTEVEFFVPGTSTPASVRGFGAIFCDTEFANSAKVEYLDPDGNVLYSRNVLVTTVFMKGFSFLGVVFDAGEVVARVRLTTGYGPIDTPQSGGDAVVMDDFVYAEPNSPPTFASAGTLTRLKGSSGVVTLGNASDLQTPAAQLQVSVDSLPTGISVSDLQNAGGQISGLVTVDCATPIQGGIVDLKVSDGNRSAIGSVTVLIASAPLVTPPAAVSVTQSLCQGGLPGTTLSTLQTRWPAQQAALAAFLAGGSAAEICSPPATGLPAQLLGADVGATSFFAVGANQVTFRFQNASSLVGVADAVVNVQRAGDVDLDGDVDLFDLVTLSGAIVGNYAPGTAPFLALATTGDVDASGTLDVFDLVLQAGHIVGNVACLAPQP